MLSSCFDIIYEFGLYNVYFFREVKFFDKTFFECSLVRSFRFEQDAINYLLEKGVTL